LDGDSSDVDKTLSCTSLGADFGKKGPPIAPPPAHGDSMWLVCDSQTVVLNVLEHRDASGTGRAPSMAPPVGGSSIVKGDLDAKGNASLSGGKDSFKGTATLDTGSPSVKLQGTYTSAGTAFSVDQTVKCAELFSDL